MKVDIKIESRDLEKKIERIIRLAPGYIENKMEKSVMDLAAHIKERKLSGQVLKVRSGALRRSIGWEVKGLRGRVQGRVGTAMVYAKIHEYGGDIRPRRARALTIPLRAAMTGAGVVKKKAREYSNTFIAKGTIFQRKNGDIIPLFKLAKLVRIKKRPYMRPAMEEKKQDIINRLGQAIMEIR